jgi:hypothetical protein
MPPHVALQGNRHGARLRLHLELGAAEWPRDLVGSSSLSNMRNAAGGFPHEVAGLFAECHLSLPERTDLVARVVAADRFRLRDGGSCPSSFLPFVRLWCDAEHPAFHLPAIDIEWDDDSAQPFLCPYFEPDLLRGHRAIEARRRQRAALGQECLALARGPAVLRALDSSIPEVWLERLAECVHALPDYGLLIPGWSQRTRPGGAARPALRAIIALPRHTVPSYLECTRWGGDVSEALAWMNLLRPSSPWIGFDVDIGDAGLGSRLGFYQEHPCVRSNDSDIADALARLAIVSLCEPKRLRGLSEWVTRQPAQPERGQGRSLSLKLVIGASARPVLKAYVSTFDVPVAMRASESAPAAGEPAAAGVARGGS